MTLDALTPASVHSLWSTPKCLNLLCLTVFSSLWSSLLLVHIFLPNFFLPVNFAFNMLWYSTPWTATPFSNDPLWLSLFVEGVNDRLLDHCQVSSVHHYYSVTKFVGRKEADRVGSWRLRYVYLRQINSHRCALCVTRKHQLSRSSPRSLSAFVPTVSLWQLVRSSLHSVSLSELPFHGGFYPVSTPITTIRHRWSSFCTWPTYLPLSPESFSRCRLR